MKTAIVSTEANTILVVRLDQVQPNLDQPRRYFNEKRLAELAESIVEYGQRVAIHVRERPEPDGPRYEIIDGERRWRAHQLAGLSSIRAEVKSVASSDVQFVQSVVANFGREEHTPMEAARAVQRISAMPEFQSLSKGERDRRIAALFARGVEWVYMQQRLMSLSPDIHELIEAGETLNQAKRGPRLNPQVAMFLTSIAEPSMRSVIAKQIVDNKLAPPAARTLIRKTIESVGLTPGQRGRRPGDDLAALSRNTRRLGTTAEALLDCSHQALRTRMADPGAREELLDTVRRAISALEQVRDAALAASPKDLPPLELRSKPN